MRTLAAIVLLGLAGPAVAADGWEELAERLTFNSPGKTVVGRFKGALDVEGYQVERAGADLVYAGRGFLFNPRLSLDLDARVGRSWYLFLHSRIDRGFDPAEAPLEARLDEYAVRWTPVPGTSVQAGKFATVVGNWTQRHSAWNNPFVNAPLPYDNLTGIWDVAAAPSPDVLLSWAHVRPVADAAAIDADKHLRLPIIWGPAYGTGVSLAGAAGRLEFALEAKNTAVSARPEQWDLGESGWHRPALQARVGLRPNEMWNIGVSLGRGDYLTRAGRSQLAASRGRQATDQRLLAGDVSFAWHRVQVWGEIFHSDFAAPGIGRVGTLAYYLESKYTFAPQWFGAVRWGRQTFDEVRMRNGGTAAWGRETWRAEAAVGHRFSANLQLKVQLGLRHESPAVRRTTRTAAAQFTARF